MWRKPGDFDFGVSFAATVAGRWGDFGDVDVSFVSTVAGHYTRRGRSRLSVRGVPLIVLRWLLFYYR